MQRLDQCKLSAFNSIQERGRKTRDYSESCRRSIGITRDEELSLFNRVVSDQKDNTQHLLFIPLRAGVCDLALSFGEGADGDKDKRMSRPFGVALLIAGWDDLNGHQLFFSDPSGTFVQYKAKAIGAGSEGAQSTLSESYNEDMTLEEAEELALSTLKQVMEEKISTENVELARVTEGKGYHGATAEEVGAVLERL